jgi:hypothetical protein
MEPQEKGGLQPAGKEDTQGKEKRKMTAKA